MTNKLRFLARHRAAHCVPPSERGSARALALRGRTCAPPLRRSLGRKVFRATLCVSHSRRRRSPSIPNLTINSATWRLSTPRSLPELIHTRMKCIISVSSVSVRSFVRNRGCRRQRRARLDADFLPLLSRRARAPARSGTQRGCDGRAGFPAQTRLASWCGVAARAARERAQGRVEQRPKAQPRLATSS